MTTDIRYVRPGGYYVARIEAGAPAPPLDTSYPDADGVQHNIADDLKRGPVVLGIYKSSCAASKEMMPMLGRIADRYGPDGATVYGVAQDSPNITRSFARRYDLNYPILIEGPDYPVSESFDIFATPSVFVIDPDGTVRYTTMGFMRPQVNDVAAAVAASLGQEPVEVVGEDEPDIPMFVPG